MLERNEKKSSYSLVLFLPTGSCKCSRASNSEYLQCIIGLSYILADICHYGSSNVCRKILQGN